MKFRYKVLLISLILLSFSLGIVGYLMIRRNFELALNTQIKNAIMENNLVQSSVEYELLQELNSGTRKLEKPLSEIGERVVGGMFVESSSLYIRYADTYVYSSDGEEDRVRDSLFSDLNIGGKNYMICQEEDQYYIYVTSYSNVNKKDLCIISKQEVTDSYRMLDEQIRYFRMLILGNVLAASVILYLLSVYLTRPLETLNRAAGEITAGNYDVHVHVTSNDEVGQLAENVNVMADAVLAHVEELNDMIRRRDQFVADFTHEIKTPMTAIIGYSDVMRSMELSQEEQMMALNYIFSEGKRLEAMSGKLFELIYLKQHEIKRLPVHTEDLEREIVRVITPMLKRKSITLQTDVESGVIYGDKELLVTVFVNLIDNARKASHEGAEIRLLGRRSRECETSYEWQVIDSGIGMSKEDVERICDEFYMVDKSRSRKEGGAGLGLSLVSLILEQHQAELHVESTPGKGTTMRVVLYEKREKDSEKKKTFL